MSTDKQADTDERADANVTQRPGDTIQGVGHTPTRMLTVDEILAADDIEERTVEVPQWGGSVRVRGLTKARQQQLRRKSMRPAFKNGKREDEFDNDRFEMFLFIESVVEPQFTEDRFEQLREKAAGALDVVLSTVMELNGYSKEAAEKAERQFPG